MRTWLLGSKRVPITIGIMLVVALGLVVFVQQTLSSIARNLPTTLLEQERNAEALIRAVADLAWSVEFWSIETTESSRRDVQQRLEQAEYLAALLSKQTAGISSDHAIGMQAIVDPALQDMRRWFLSGMTDQPAGSPAVMALMQGKAREAENQLLEQMTKSRDMARNIVREQEQRITGFAIGVSMLIGLVALLVVGLVVLLLRQSHLLDRMQDAEATLLAAKRTAEEANRAKSDFLANMSHELRTPLNAIIGFSTMIKDEMLGPIGQSRYRGYATDIHASGEHLLSIISDILDLSKVEAGKLELLDAEFEAAEVMQAAVRLVRDKAERDGLALKLVLPPQPVRLFADRRAVLQILLNLLSNAVKFTEAGSIELSSAMLADGGFQFIVKDTGIGMTEAQLARALEPFYQVQTTLTREQSGTGLGLPLVERLVSLHGGSLRLTSRFGYGTTVFVSLPAGRIRV
ncbi:sensor histidine kinase [Ferrovibrio sp.]|uniref:sensor histidine kinase n=1 Tax=Ferrovibrio sp. TaxID=1917215 RepID=UPI0035AE31EF